MHITRIFADSDEKMRTYRDYLVEVLSDRDEAIGHIQAILEDYQIYKNPSIVRETLYTVIDAQGGVMELAKETDMDPQVFSKMLSNEDTPLIDALGIVLKVLGYQLSIAPIESNTYTDMLERQNTSTQVAENQTK